MFNLGWTKSNIVVLVAVTFLLVQTICSIAQHVGTRTQFWPHKNLHKIYQQRCQALLLGKEIIFCPMNGDQRGVIGYPASNPLILQLNWSEMAT